jgi:RND family efflux transporter MFP subunit
MVNMTRFNSTRVYSALFLLGLAVLVFLFMRHQPEAPKPSDNAELANTKDSPKSALTVHVIKLKQMSLPTTISATGNIAPWQEAIIGAESNGLMLQEVLVNVGDTVKKGQVIARFNANTIQAEMAQTNANIAEVTAALAEAKSNADRARSIEQTGALSAQQIQQYITAESTANAKLIAMQATLSGQQIKLKQTTVLAPDAGVISSRTATVGAVTSAGQELFKLIRQGRLEWRAEVTSADLSQISIGTAATLTLPDGQVVDGKVRAFAPNVDTQTRNAFVYIDLTHAHTAKAGMFARGQLLLENADAWLVPNAAIVMRDGFAFLMQVTPKHSIKQVNIQLGRQQGAFVEVQSDVDTAADYVASGGAFLEQGDTVKVVPLGASAQ